MKWMFLFMLVLALSVGVALVALEDPGYVLLSYGQWTLETSLALFAAAVLALVVLLYYTQRLIGAIWALPAQLRERRERRRALSVYQALNEGLIALAEGRFGEAEQLLGKNVPAGPIALLNHLGAARAAQAQGAFERRDDYLRAAYENAPQAQIAVGVTQAELLLDQHAFEHAAAILGDLYRRAPRHVHVLRLLAKAYVVLRDWRALEELLPELRKTEVMNEDALNALARKSFGAQLDAAAAQAGTLRDIWARVPKTLVHDPQLLSRYVELLVQNGDTETGEPLLKEAIAEQWDARLVYWYGRVFSPRLAQQLSHAERWLKQHPQDATLLLSLGRLCLRNKLWGKARTYLEAAVGIADCQAEIYQELGALLEKLGEHEQAVACFRQGIALAQNCLNSAQLEAESKAALRFS